MTSNIEAAFKREYADIVNALEKKLYDYISIDRAIYVVSCYIRNKSSRDKNKSNNYLYRIMLHGIQIKRMFDKNKNSDVRYYYEIIRSDLKKIKLENCNKTLLKNTSDIFCKILSLRVEGIRSYYVVEFSFWHNLKLVNFLDPNNKNFIKIIKKFTEEFLSYKRYNKYSFNICFKDFYRLKKISFTSQDIINRINEIDEHVIKIKTLDARINQIREELKEYEKLNQYETIYKRVLELYDTELYDQGSLIYYHIKSLACIGKHKEAFNLMVEKNTPDYDCFELILNTNDTDLIYQVIGYLKCLVNSNEIIFESGYCYYIYVAFMKLGYIDTAIKCLKLIIDNSKYESDRNYYIKILKKAEKQKYKKTQKNEIVVSQTITKNENEIINSETCSLDEILSLDSLYKEKVENGDKCYYDGVKALNDKNYDRAIELFNSAFVSHNYSMPKDDIHVMRGIAYANIGKDNEALNDFNTAIGMFSFDNPTAFLERGKIYSKRNEFEKALKDYNNAITTNSGTNGDDFFYRGLLYLKMDNKEFAIQDFEKALSLCQKTNSETYIKCQSLIKDLKNKVSQNSEKTATTSNTKSIKKEDLIIDLQTCSYNEILLLEGFDEDKARDFIQKRDSGLMWYNIDSFVQSFSLQPHEMILIQNKIVFPPKPKVKYVRKLDL